MEILNVVSIIIAGLMVGTELAIVAFVHPSLERLPDDVHLPVANGLAQVTGESHARYILVFLLTLAGPSSNGTNPANYRAGWRHRPFCG